MQRLAARERVGVRARAQVARDAAPVAELLVVLVDVALLDHQLEDALEVALGALLVRIRVRVRVRVRVRRSLLVHSLAKPKG